MLGFRRRGFEVTRSPAAGAVTFDGRRAVLVGTSGAQSDLILTSWRNSQQTLAWIYPSSDTVDNAHWRHRMAPAGIPWSIPLGVRGGGYPYNFDTLIVPNGMVVVYEGRTNLRPPYYEYLYWPDPQIGTHSIRLRARDQNGSAVDIEWTLNVYSADDTNRFLFLNSSTGSHGGTGTRSSPKLDFSDWYISEFSTTYRFHQIFYEGGFNVGGLSGVSYDGSSGQQFVIDATKPVTHVGIGSCTWNGNGAYWFPQAGTGAFVGGLTYQDPDTVEGGTRNQHFRTSNSWLADGALFGVTFVGNSITSAEGSNSSCIQIVGGTTDTNYCFIGCTAESIGSQIIFQNYDGLDGLFAGWEIRNCSSTVTIVHHKGGDIRRWQTRGCRAVDNNTGTMTFQDDQWIANPVARHDIDVCWNSVRLPGRRGRFTNGASGDDFARIDTYRNNFAVPYNETRNVNSGVLTFEDNVIQHSGEFTNGSNVNSGGTVSPAFTDNSIASSGLLDATTNLRVGGPDGTHGCEMVAA